MQTFLVHDRLSGAIRGTPEPTSKLTQSIAYLTPQSSSSELAFIRILLGTTVITHVATGNTWSQTIDYSIVGVPTSTISTRPALLTLLKGRGLEPKSLDRHLRVNLRQNAYYEELCAEILHALYRSNMGQHTLAFLHIYRLLERVSYAFPLLYAARTRDFRSTFTTFKALFEGGSEKSELGFFRKFFSTCIDEALRDGQSKIELGHMPTDQKQSAFSVLKRLIHDNDIKSSTEGEELEIRNESILDLIVELRNRYFHFNSSHAKNVTAIEVPDSDSFFFSVNGLFLNWLAVIYFEVMTHNLEGISI